MDYSSIVSEVDAGMTFLAGGSLLRLIWHILVTHQDSHC
jgi:hypothetical protein